MIRILVVLDQSVNVDIRQFQADFAGTHLIVTRESSQSLQLLCQQNPDVIVSIGEVPSNSFLWKLPYWRRLRWLNLPDDRHSSVSIWQAALSLLAGTCDSSLSINDPQIGAICLSQDPRDIATAYSQIFEGQLYDNLSFLVQDALFEDVVSLLARSSALGSVVRIPDTSGHTPFSQMLNATRFSKAHYLWPVSRASLGLDKAIFDVVVETLKNKKPDGIIVGEDIELECIPNEILQGQTNSVSQLILSSEQILRCNKFGQDFPLESLSALLLNLLLSSSVEVIESTSPVTDAPNDWWLEEDVHRNALLTANVRYVQHIQAQKNKTKGVRNDGYAKIG